MKTRTKKKRRIKGRSCTLMGFESDTRTNELGDTEQSRPNRGRVRKRVAERKRKTVEKGEVKRGGGRESDGEKRGKEVRGNTREREDTISWHGRWW